MNFSQVRAFLKKHLRRRHRHWTELPAEIQEHTGYGSHEKGFGVYRFDPKTFEIVEWWPDFPNCYDWEIKEYEKWCEENNLKPLKET